MKILIISACTGQKTVKHENALVLEDFLKGDSHIKNREKELSDSLTIAENLYSGQQHVHLMKGIKHVRDRQADVFQDCELDFWILSAGYGLIPGDKKIAPYESTFQGMKANDIKRLAEARNIPSDFRNIIKQSYDLGLILLGDEYLKACCIDGDVQFGGMTLLFCGKQAQKRLPQKKLLKPVVLSNKEAKRFSCGLVSLKGKLTAQLLEKLAEDPQIIEQTTNPKTDILGLFNGLPKQHEKRIVKPTFRENPNVDYTISIPKSWLDKPHRKKLKYFIPEWDDLVDPDYDFMNDIHSGGRGDWSNQIYAHQIYPEPNYDGILMSRAVAEKSKKKKKRINQLGVHRYLRVPREFPIMGDCGAFDYIMEEMPPYSTEDVIDYYTRLDFDYGVSVDHMILTSTEKLKNFRYELTIHNADEFINAHRKAGLNWKPLGAVQGWDPASYAKAASKYVKMGYKYLALGGLVRTKSKNIISVIEKVREVIPPDVKIHLFGVARLDAIQDFIKVGVNSVDSASYLRQAWMRLHQSYASVDGPYAAFRIPEAGKSFRAKHMLNHPELTDEKIVSLEQNALNALRRFDKDNCSIDECLDTLLEYDRFVTKDRVSMKEAYRKTLEDQPWKKCECEICKKCGVEVAIFRGNNRNRRRGFHNTYVFYKLLQETIAGKPPKFIKQMKNQKELPFQWNRLK